MAAATVPAAGSWALRLLVALGVEEADDVAALATIDLHGEVVARVGDDHPGFVARFAQGSCGHTSRTSSEACYQPAGD